MRLLLIQVGLALAAATPVVEARVPTADEHELTWMTDLDAALARAEAEPERPLLIVFR